MLPLIIYGLGGSLLMAKTNDYQMLLALQAVSVLLLMLIAWQRKTNILGLELWLTMLASSLVARLISLAVTRGKDVNKAAKFRRWDSFVTTIGYAVTLGYLLTSTINRRSVVRYIELTAIGIPTATATVMALMAAKEDADLSSFATLCNKSYTTPSFVDKDTDTRVFFEDNVVAFAGTDSEENLKTNIKVADTSFPVCGNAKTRVHLGFLKAWNSVRQTVFERIKGMEHVTCTGHSLGGALASLAALDIACSLGVQVTVVTFGSPQVGDELFVDAFDAKISKSIRIVSPLDPVPKSLSSQFAHVRGVYYIATPGLNPHSLDAYAKGVETPGNIVGIVLPSLCAILVIHFVGLRVNRIRAR